MKRILYFRIGMDTGVGGCVGPVFPDLGFEYIPIPDLITTEKCTYSSCMGRNGFPFSKYVPKKLHNQRMHYDPDFRKHLNVYGDGTTHQKYFSQLRKGDIVLFYAGLTPWIDDKKLGGIDLYIIGFLITEKVYKVDHNNINKIKSNAHSKRYEHIVNLSKVIEENHKINFEYLLDIYLNKDSFNKIKILDSIHHYSKNNKIKYSNIRNFDKNVEKIIEKENWECYIKQSSQEDIMETYTYLLDKFSQFTLVYGSSDSKLLKKAIKISIRSFNKSRSTENVVSKKWSPILGIPHGLSLQRKNPRWIPNNKYDNLGKIDEIMNILM